MVGDVRLEQQSEERTKGSGTGCRVMAAARLVRTRLPREDIFKQAATGHTKKRRMLCLASHDEYLYVHPG